MRPSYKIARADVFSGIKKHHIIQIFNPGLFEPVSYAFTALLTRAALIWVGAEDEKNLRVINSSVFHVVKPCEHVFEERIGVHLAGVEDDVRKDRNYFLDRKSVV